MVSNLGFFIAGREVAALVFYVLKCVLLRIENNRMEIRLQA